MSETTTSPTAEEIAMIDLARRLHRVANATAGVATPWQELPAHKRAIYLGMAQEAMRPAPKRLEPGELLCNVYYEACGATYRWEDAGETARPIWADAEERFRKADAERLHSEAVETEREHAAQPAAPELPLEPAVIEPPKPVEKTLGQRVRIKRGHRKIRDIAGAIGISPSAVSRVERDFPLQRSTREAAEMWLRTEDSF